MKTKGFIILGASLIIAGLITFLYAFSSLGWDGKKLDIQTYTAANWERSVESEPINQININTNFKVNIVKGDKVSLSYYETEYRKTEISQDSTTLSINEKISKSKWYHSVFDFSFTYAWTLTVTDGVTINCTNNNTNVNFNAVTLNDVIINSNNLTADFNNSTINNLNIDSTNVNVDLKGSTFNNIVVDGNNIDCSVELSTGKDIIIDATNLDIDAENSQLNSISLNGNNIDVDIDNSSVNSFTAESNNFNGDFTLKGNIADYNINVTDVTKYNQSGATEKKILIDSSNTIFKLRFI